MLSMIILYTPLLMDSTDHQLLSLLRRDARTPVVRLARELGVSRATVQNRLSRLEHDGVILGYTVRLNAEHDRAQVRALICIACAAKQEAAVIRALRGEPAISAIHHTTGQWDVIAEIRTDTLAELNAAIGKVRLFDGVSTTETNLLLDSHEFRADKSRR